jgi:hypothetical protein
MRVGEEAALMLLGALPPGVNLPGHSSYVAW